MDNGDMAEILIADDDGAIRTVLSQALSREGYEVRVTSNAATLWRWVAAGDGDLVVTDVIMPDESISICCPASNACARSCRSS